MIVNQPTRKALGDMSTLDAYVNEYFCWSAKQIEDALSQKEPAANCRLCWESDLLVAFLIYNRHDTAYNVVRFVAHPDYKVVAEEKIIEVLNQKKASKVSSILYSVNEYDTTEQLFLKEVGWRCTKIKKECGINYYVFEKKLTGNIFDSLMED